MKIYVAGPMTGLPGLNYPAFHQAAAALRAAGHDVTNPAENPAPECGSWLGYMRMSVSQVAQADCVAMLPGWWNSPGARLERHIAEKMGLQIMNIEA